MGGESQTKSIRTIISIIQNNVLIKFVNDFDPKYTNLFYCTL